MARLRILALLPLLALAGGCSESDSPTDPGGGTVAFTTVYEAQYTGVDTGRVQVVESAGEWAGVWQEIQRRSSPPAPVPAVDFTRKRLLVAAAGVRPNGCYALNVERIDRRGGVLAATLVETVPGDTCGCTQALTQPLHVVSLDSSDEPIASRTERRAARCG